MKLTGNNLTLEFDDGTGSLVQIEDSRRGIQHLSAAEDGRLFRVTAPDEENWLGRYCDSDKCGQPEVTLEGTTLLIHYPELQTVAGTTTGIEATVRVDLPEDADEAVFSLTVQNGGSFTIHEIWFPRVGGWRGYDDGEPAEITIGSQTRLSPLPELPWRKVGPKGGAATLAHLHRQRYYTFPGIRLPTLDISNGSKGLSYIHYPSCPRQGGVVIEDLNHRAGEAHPAWSWVFLPYIDPGQTWTSDPVGISCHGSDWHQTADRLRGWLNEWWQPPEAPKGLRSSIGYFNIQSREFEGPEINPLRDLPECARYVKAHGIDDLCIWDTIMSVYYKPGDGDILAERPERLDEFRRVLKEVRNLGMQVSTLINLRLLSHKFKPWQKWGKDWVQRSYYGDEMREAFSSVAHAHSAMVYARHLENGGVSLCQNHPEFQEWALGKIEELLELGFSSVFIDQPFDQDGLCFAPDHGHDVPAHGHEGACQLIRSTVDMIRARDSDAYAIGEDADLWNSRYIHLWWSWGLAGSLLDVWRYTLPDSIQSWVIDGTENPCQIGSAFASGCLLSLNVKGLEKPLSTEPLLAERVKRLAALRQRTAAFTVEGRFVDQRGLSIDADCPVAAYIYESADALGIVLGEISSSPSDGGGEVRLSIDLQENGLTYVSAIRLYREDGSLEDLNAEVDRRSIKINLPLCHWESAVLELR